MRKKFLSLLLVLVLCLGVVSPALAGALETMQQTAQAIADGYLDTMDTANYPWVVADLAAGEKSGAISGSLSTEQRQDYVDAAVAAIAEDNASTGDLAKYSLGLTALGYDVSRLTTADNVAINGLDKLVAKAATETSEYSLPYLILALYPYASTEAVRQSDALDTAVTALLARALPEGGWGYGACDGDTTGPALLALSLFAGDNDVDAAIAQAKSALQTALAESQDANGALVSWGSTSTESTALLIMGLRAVGEDPDTFLPLSLTDGLVSRINDTQDGFLTSGMAALSTEQGFRGLLSLLAADASYCLYDFSGQSVLVPAMAEPLAPPTPDPGDEGDPTLSIRVRVMIHDKDACHNQITYKHNPEAYTALVDRTVTLSSGSSVYTALVRALTAEDLTYYEPSDGYIENINGISAFDHGSLSGWMYQVDGVAATVGCKAYSLNSDADVLWFYTDDYTQESGSEEWSGDRESELTETSSGGAAKEPVQQPETPLEVPAVAPPFTDLNQAAACYGAVSNLYARGLLVGTGTGLLEADAPASRITLLYLLYRLDQAPAIEQASATAPEASEATPETAAEESAALTPATTAEEPFAPVTEETAVETPFFDVPAGHWAASAAVWAFERQIAAGIGNGLLNPDGPLTYAHALAFLSRYTGAVQTPDPAIPIDNILTRGQLFQILNDLLTQQEAAEPITEASAA